MAIACISVYSSVTHPGSNTNNMEHFMTIIDTANLIKNGNYKRMAIVSRGYYLTIIFTDVTIGETDAISSTLFFDSASGSSGGQIDFDHIDGNESKIVENGDIVFNSGNDFHVRIMK